MNPSDIIDYWYSDRIKQYWFSSTPELDEEIRNNYEEIWRLAKRGGLNSWKESPEGCLALAIILDQFPLNMFRGKPQSFETEEKAIEVTIYAINHNYDEKIEKEKLSFLIMPLMHSENIKDQDLSIYLFKKHNLTSNLSFAEHHRNIVKEFGRFPHRNKILGRESTNEELEYLESKNSFKG